MIPFILFIALILILPTAYLRQTVKQLDVTPIGDNMVHGPTIHVEKRLYQVLWDEWGRPLWWFVLGAMVGYGVGVMR